MGLCSPTIVGPLSELSGSIRVQGQLVGALVTINSVGPNPRTVAKKIVTSSDERIDLSPGTALDRKDRLIALQEFNGETSIAATYDLAVPIQARPSSSNEVGHVGYETHLYECGDALFVSGGIPGALI